MPDDGLFNSIRQLTTPEYWAAGKKLFLNGGVMNVLCSPRAIEAKVANERFLFERVTVNTRSGRLSCSCTCGAHTRFCAHVVAMLLYMGREMPEKLDGLPILGSATKSAETENSTVEHFSANSISVEAIRDYLDSSSPAAQLILECDGELPQLTLAGQRLSLKAALLYGKRSYTMGNIKRLSENLIAAGGMRLTDFHPQAQQVLCFLAKYASFETGCLTLDSSTSADLFHCLRGSSMLKTSSGTVQFHLTPLQIQFNVTERQEDGAVITPCLLVPSRGNLTGSDKLTFVAGRGGYWIGRELEYWWFPGIIPFGWLRMFIQGRPLKLSSGELTRLIHLCEEQGFPGKVFMDDAIGKLDVVQGIVKPVLTLDWDADGLKGDLQFDYNGKRVETGGNQVINAGGLFIRRDTAAEAAAMELLKTAGFHQTDASWHGLRLESTEQIWDFMRGVQQGEPLGWLVFCTPQVRLNTMATADAQVQLQAGDAIDGWFHTSCDLKSADGKPIPFKLAVEAVQADERFIRLPSGAVAHLSEDVFKLLYLLIKRASERRDNKFTMKKFHAVILAEAMTPFWNSATKPDWFSLKNKILHPEDGPALLLPHGLDDVLRDYQKEGVRWVTILGECGFNGILADEMGLGKTVQALAALAARKAAGEDRGPSLVVCPTSLLENWRAEAAKFTPELSVITISGADRTRNIEKIPEYDLAVTSYALLRRDSFDYEGLEFDYVILDEAQHIKNSKTANALACKVLKANRKLVLTGTPMENSPGEIWSLFDFLLPGYLGGQRDFRNSFIAPKDPERQNEMAEKLSAMIRPFVLRRTKSQVCAELPPKLEQDMFCELGPEQRKLYDNLLLASRSFLNNIHAAGLDWKEHRMEILSMILRLRQACCHPGMLPEDMLAGYPEDMPSVKLELAKEVILEAIDSGHRILFFSQFTKLLKLIPPWLKKAGIPFEYIDGTTQDRQKRVDNFNGDPSIPVFLLSLKAGGVGLNLHGADTVIHFDQWWNPMVEDQATDRSHRIGQTRTVTSIRLVTRNTIEEKILRLQNAKRSIFNKVLGDAPSSLNEISKEDIDYLLE